MGPKNKVFASLIHLQEAKMFPCHLSTGERLRWPNLQIWFKVPSIS
jgi:hypothetical protein